MSDCIELTVTACKQNTSIVVVAASRLMFAVARDGVLPLLGWISQVDKDGQPRHAVTVIFVVAALLLYSILPNTVAFTSLVSAGGLPLIASWFDRPYAPHPDMNKVSIDSFQAGII